MAARYPVPEGLSERSARLWKRLVPSRAKSAGRLAAIEEALRSLDRADQAAVELQATGLTTVTEGTGAVHVHPLVRVEREHRQLFLATWERLGLSWHPDDGRKWR